MAIDILLGIVTVLYLWFGLANLVGTYRLAYRPLLYRSLADFALAFSCLLQLMDQTEIGTVIMLVVLFWMSWLLQDKAYYDALRQHGIRSPDLLLFRKRDQHRPK